MSDRPSRFQLPQLSRTFAVKFLSVCIVLTIVQCALEYQNIHRLLIEQVDQRAQAIASNFTLLNKIGRHFSTEEANRLADWNVRNLDDVESIYLVDARLNILAHAAHSDETKKSQTLPLLTDPVIRQALEQSFADRQSHEVDLATGKIPLHALIVPLPSLDASMIVTINLVAMRNDITATVLSSTMRRIGVMLILLIITFILIHRSVLAPLSLLSRAVKSSRASGRYVPPVTMPRDEIGALADVIGEVFQELKQSVEENEHLAQVANGTHAGVLIADASGRIVWANVGFTQQTGFPRSEIEGRTPADIANNGHIIGAVDVLNKALRFGLGCNIETLNHTRNGQPYWAAIEVRPIRTELDQIKNFIVVETDITPFKNAEKALQVSQSQIEDRVAELQETYKILEAERSKLDHTARELAVAKDAAEQANRAKSDFLATMSHEIRTPMNGVIGLADILLQSEMTPRQREQTMLIKESGENLLTIINGILDHSKLEAGRLELDSSACAPRDIASSVLDLMQSPASKKGLSLTSEIADDVPAAFLCDGKRLRQILLNFIGNAVKFTSTGSVELRIFLNASDDTAKSRIVFAVRDTGIGIPESVLPKLFNRYTQAHASTATTHGGTGLGLAISRELATLMNGSIDVVSAPGIGTTFSLILPLDPVETIANPMPTSSPLSVNGAPLKDQTPQTPTTTAPDATKKKLRVLLAEDQPVNQKLMRAVMEQLEHDLTIANNGVEAVKAMRQSTFDLILMDIQMPELDGILTTKVIRSADASWSRIPIIALTAHAMESHRKTYMSAGMDGFVSKPFRMDVLVGEIARVLNETQQNEINQPAQPDNDTTAAPKPVETDAKEAALTDMLDDLESLIA